MPQGGTNVLMMRLSFLTVFFLFAISSAQARDYWKKASTNDTLTGLDPSGVCGLLSLPGDFRVTTGYYNGDPSKISSQIGYHLTDELGFLGALVDGLAGHNPYQQYSHSGLVTGISYDFGVQMSSWFNGRYAGLGDHGEQNYAVYRVEGGLKVNEKAMANSRILLPKGVCADGVDAMFDHRIRFSERPSWVVSAVSPGITAVSDIVNLTTNTPTRLTKSPIVQRICQVVNFTLTYPKSIQTKQLMDVALTAKNSSERTISEQSKQVLRFLEKMHYISGDQVIVDSISFENLNRDRNYGTYGFRN